jgi:uncharacterized protein YozE (UPF0346 family)
MDFRAKCAILSEIWEHYTEEEDLKDFLEYNDVGLPIAHFIHTGMVEPLAEAFEHVEETYNMLVEILGLDLKESFSTFDEMLDKYEE